MHVWTRTYYFITSQHTPDHMSVILYTVATGGHTFHTTFSLCRAPLPDWWLNAELTTIKVHGVLVCLVTGTTCTVSDRTMKGIFRTVCSKGMETVGQENDTYVQVETQLCPIHKSSNMPYPRLLLYEKMCAFHLNNT